MNAINQQSASATRRRGPPKRVAHACEYCRRKRLKCTANEVPCMNCRLYGETCTYSSRNDGYSSRTAGKGSGQKSRKRTEARTPLSLSPCGTDGPAQPKACNGVTGNCITIPGDSVQMDNSFLSTSLFSYPPGVPSDLILPSDFSHEFPLGSTELSFDNESSTPPFPNIMGYPTPEMRGMPFPPPCWQDQYPNTKDQSEPLSTVPSLLRRGGSGDGKFVGLTAIKSTISACLEMTTLDLKVLHPLVQGTEHMDELYQLNIVPAAISELALPPPDYVERSIAAYIENVHIHYPILDLRQLENWRDMYKALEVSIDQLQYTRLCLLISIGTFTLDENKDHRWPPQDLHQRAWGLIVAALASPFIDAVEVLLLHTSYLLYTGKTGTAWVVSGLVIRIAQSLGLHQDMQTQREDKQAQRRSSLWEVAYGLDAFLSLAEGRPPATTDHPDDPLPSVRNLGERQSAEMAVTEVHTWRVQLSRIANRASSLLNRGAVGPWVLEDLAILDQELTQWRDSMPMEYRPEQRILASGRVYSAVSFLHLQYFNLMQTVHWASFVISMQVTDPGLLAQRAPRIRCSESACLVAARSVIETMNHVRLDAGQKVRFTGIPVSYCMAAIAVIFRQILSQASTISARILVEYLRAGTLHILQTVPTGGAMDHFRALSNSLKMVAEVNAEVNVDRGTR